MKKINIRLLALVFVFTVSSTSIFAQTGEGDVFGHFFSKGKAAKGFTAIQLDLGGNGEYGAQAKPPYYGDIIAAKIIFHLLKPTLNGKNLSFKTKAVKGISYEFTGILSKSDFTENPQGDDAENALSGTLNKLQNGKMIATCKINFSWELGD